MSRSTLLAALLLGLALPAAGCRSQDASGAAQDEKPTTIPVKVAQVGSGTISRVLRRTGEVRAEVEVRVFGQVPDRILDLRVDEGDRVVKGQVLAVIQSAALTAGVAQAAASLESARAQRDRVRDELGRAERLLQSNVSSPAQVKTLRRGLTAAEAQVRSLEAVVEQASTRQQQSTVRAPIRGVVGIRYLSRGDLALPQLPILTIVQMDRVKVVIQATEFDLPHLLPDTSVEIRVAAYPEDVFEGKVSRVSPVINPLTRHAQVEVLLDNKDHRLKPGMLAQVWAVLERHEGAVVVPLFSLILEEKAYEDGSPRYHAFVLEGAGARRRTLRTGLLEGKRMEVLEGLAPGETLVVRGQHLLQEGSEVEVVGGHDGPVKSSSGEAGP